MKITLLQLSALCALLGLMLSCSSNSSGGGSENSPQKTPVAIITITGPATAGATPVQLSANVGPATATDKSLTWAVSEPSVASVSANGLLTPLANGPVTVTATANDGSGVSDDFTLTISGFAEADAIEVSNEAELLSALANATAGDTIYLRGGRYTLASPVSLDENGTAESPIKLYAHPTDSARPLLDFSQMSVSSSNRGVKLSGDYWHIKGLDLTKAGDNCMHVSGSNNIIEFSTFSECADTGLQLGNGAANNTILNCDSFYNADPDNEDADGFAAKLSVGDNNRFIGSRAWQNSDDGWDGYLRESDNIQTTYENCWAFGNGYLKDGTRSKGDGNGFKTGGSDTKDKKHNAVFERCIAANNVADGFDHNSNRGLVEIFNCAAHDNGRNFNFSSTNPAEVLVIKNSASIGNNGSLNADTKDITHNSWQNGLQATDADFESMDNSQLSAPRKADGSLPDIDYLQLNSDSDLVDAGIDVGLPFNGTAPDVGVFESTF